jgi:hypothetical protein
MVRLFFGFYGQSGLSKYQITATNVGSYRTCEFGNYKLNKSSPWAQISSDYAYGNWILCNARDGISFSKEYTDQSNTLSFKISSDVQLSIRVLSIYLVEQYAQKMGETIIPICGRPDIPYGVMIYTVEENFRYNMNCKNKFVQIGNNQNKNLTIDCIVTSKWNRKPPECLPKSYCPMLVKSDENNLSSVASYVYVYYRNIQIWYAIEGTKAALECQDRKNLSITCLSDGQWSKDCNGRGNLTYSKIFNDFY